MSILTLLVALVVLGFFAWLAITAPFLEATFKEFIKWVLIALAGVLVIVYLLSLIGQGPAINFHW